MITTAATARATSDRCLVAIRSAACTAASPRPAAAGLAEAGLAEAALAEAALAERLAEAGLAERLAEAGLAAARKSATALATGHERPSPAPRPTASAAAMPPAAAASGIAYHSGVAIRVRNPTPSSSPKYKVPPGPACASSLLAWIPHRSPGNRILPLTCHHAANTSNGTRQVTATTGGSSKPAPNPPIATHAAPAVAPIANISAAARLRGRARLPDAIKYAFAPQPERVFSWPIKTPAASSRTAFIRALPCQRRWIHHRGT